MVSQVTRYTIDCGELESKELEDVFETGCGIRTHEIDRALGEGMIADKIQQ